MKMYNGIGDRQSKQRDTQSVDNYVYSNHRLVTANGLNMSYDANGNMTARGNQVFTYNQDNRLSTAIVATGQFAYAYDYAGRRISKTSAGVNSTYIYDMDGLNSLSLTSRVIPSLNIITSTANEWHSSKQVVCTIFTQAILTIH